MTYRYTASTTLAADELAAIDDLVQIVDAHDHVTLRLNREMLERRAGTHTDDFLAWDGDRLIGYLGMYGFGRPEIEASGMVHPEYRRQGVFDQLAAMARADARQRGHTSILWFIERPMTTGKAWLDHAGAIYSSSEFLMEFQNPPQTSQSPIAVALRPMRPDEREFRQQVLSEAFDMPASDVSDWMEREQDEAQRRMEIITTDSGPAGIIGSSENSRGGYIFGFAVSAAMRGKGIGRQALQQVVQRQHAAGVAPIHLEVATQNDHALGLYRSCGFEMLSAYDYYTEPL